MFEVGCIGFGSESPLVWFLHKILVSLLLCKGHCVFFRLEVKMCALHRIRRRLPAHEWIFPSVTLLQYVPVHTPCMTVPVTGLSRRFCGLMDPAQKRVRLVKSKEQEGYADRTCRPCRSTGAPDKRAPGAVIPGSLPSITRLGKGEKVLEH